MPWEMPRYSLRTVRRAGEILAFEEHPDTGQLLGEKPDPRPVLRWLAAEAIFNNWRAAHAYPLNTFQVTLRGRAHRVDPDALTAQRLKRAPSMLAKLKRFPGMNLDRMQDIGGCRAIVSELGALEELTYQYQNSRSRHELVGQKDYVREPKDDGYRGIHLVYRYAGRGASAAYDGLRIEIQLRTKIQHAWATAVETVGLFQGEAFKAGEGNARWLEFFRLASEAFASLEIAPWPADRPLEEIQEELMPLVLELDVLRRLRGYSETLERAEVDGIANSYLLELDLQADRLQVRSFMKNEGERARAAYVEAEARMGASGDVVLVAVSDAAALQRAFPNYFADTRLFLDTLRTALEWDGG